MPHAAALDVADWARQLGVRRPVFAHLGRPTIRAMDAGSRPGTTQALNHTLDP
jgi:hypothetical protein